MKILNKTFGLLTAVLLLQSCSVQRPKVVDPDKIQGPGTELSPQKKYSFKQQGIYFSSDFSSARLNDVTLVNDSTFMLHIKPENKPINPSPWYAFQVWSEGHQTRNVHLILDYQDFKHRYDPLIKKENAAWQSVEGGTKLEEENKKAFFTVQTDQHKTLVSGQPLFNADSIKNWLKKLDKKAHVNVDKIGKSTLGSPIYGFSTPATPSRKAIVILGGQHPPEITGYQAQIAFVNFILGDHPEAVQFRQQYQIIGVPWINPDGTNLGNWRHNVAGVDLNRDWTTFVQPETQAARDYILNFATDEPVQFIFGVDFHSTYRDVLYTNVEDPNHTTHQPGLMTEWISEWDRLLSDSKSPLGPLAPNKVEPSAASGRVSKSWFLTDLKAEGVTYEVGDKTPFPIIKEKAEKAALALINVLLTKSSPN